MTDDFPSWDYDSVLAAQQNSWFSKIGQHERASGGEKPARGNASKPAANSFENHIAACSS